MIFPGMSYEELFAEPIPLVIENDDGTYSLQKQMRVADNNGELLDAILIINSFRFTVGDKSEIVDIKTFMNAKNKAPSDDSPQSMNMETLFDKHKNEYWNIIIPETND